jgi:hypothetical protein
MGQIAVALERLEGEKATRRNALEQGLSQFIGTMEYHRHFNINITDGVKYLAEVGKCFWLLDLIWSYQPQHKDKPFQVWQLEVKGSSAVATMREDTDKPILVRQEIPYTDFALDYIKLYLIDGVLLLPSEY